LSGRFRSPWIPLAISVEDHVLEIADLDSKSGLTMSDFHIRRFAHEGRGSGKLTTRAGVEKSLLVFE